MSPQLCASSRLMMVAQEDAALLFSILHLIHLLLML
jgi:hypothetical protein